MRYLTRKTSLLEVHLNDKVMVLSDFSGVPAGTKGEVMNVNDQTIGVQWLDNAGGFQGKDWFSEKELAYLVFADI